MNEQTKATPAPQGEADVNKQKSGEGKGVLEQIADAHKEDLQPNSEHAVGKEGQEKVEKHKVTDPAALGVSQTGKAQTKTETVAKPTPPVAKPVPPKAAKAPKLPTVNEKESAAQDEAKKILELVGQDTIVCSHRAAVIAIHSEGVSFNQETKVLTVNKKSSTLDIQ